MLPKINRLRGNEIFERVKKQGFIIQGDIFGLAIYNRKDKDPSRFGFVVSNKISKKAVERNRIKRILRQSLIPLLKDFKNGYDLVFLTKQAILKSKTSAIAEEVEKMAKEGGVL